VAWKTPGPYQTPLRGVGDEIKKRKNDIKSRRKNSTQNRDNPVGKGTGVKGRQGDYGIY